MLRKRLLFYFLLNLDQSSTDWVPIEPDIRFSLKTFKILISRELDLINRKIDSIDRVPIEPSRDQA